MKHRSIILIVFITSILAAVLIPTWQRSQRRFQAQQLRTDLDSLVESYKAGAVDVINISAITPFAWEKLYLFGPYSTKEIIPEVTGVKQLGYLPTMIESDDSIVLFVFVNQGEIVRYMDFHRNPDFDYAVRESGYSPSEAIFILNEKGRAMPISP